MAPNQGLGMGLTKIHDKVWHITKCYREFKWGPLVGFCECGNEPLHSMEGVECKYYPSMYYCTPSTQYHVNLGSVLGVQVAQHM